MDKIGPLRGLEFYSGLGGFHYGTTLFNKMVQNTDYFVPMSDIGIDWYRNHLEKDPNVLRPVVESIYSNNAQQYTTPPSPSTSSSTTIPLINIVESFDINPIANQVYYHNFKRAVNTTDIGKLTTDQIRSYNSNIWFISNPCQPFTIQNETNLDERDPRTNSFLHLLEILDELYGHEKPEFLVLENVENFELSWSYQILLKTLEKSGYSTISFILSPRQFGIPNQRSRFFLIASKIHRPLKPFKSLLKNGDKLSGDNIDEKEAKKDKKDKKKKVKEDVGTDVTSTTGSTSPQQQDAQQSNGQIPTQTIYKFVPTLHFIPPQFHQEYFNNIKMTQNDDEAPSHGQQPNNLELYNNLWQDPDSAFDILRSTVKPPQRDVNDLTSTTNEIANDNVMKDEQHDNEENNNKIIPMSQREHNNTRNRVVKTNWLPRTIPAKIDQYLVNFDDLSEFSYTSYCNTIGGNDMVDEKVNHDEGENTTTTTTTSTTTPSDPVESVTDIHKLLGYVKTAEDVDDLTHISKKEKNKLKRLLVKSQKRAENSTKSTTTLTPAQLLQKNRQGGSDILQDTLNNAALTKQNRLKAFLETSQSVALDPTTFLKSGVYTIDIVSPNDRSTCCFTKGYTSFFKGTGSVLETFRPKKRTELFKINPSVFTSKGRKDTTTNDTTITTSSSTITMGGDENIINSYLSTTPLKNHFPSTPSLISIISPTSPLSSQTAVEPPTVDATASQQPTEMNDNDQIVYLSQNAPLSFRGLRYFLPREVANLQMLPPSRTDWDTTKDGEFPYFSSFDWPGGISTKQKLKLLGNSLNSYLIANLLMVLLSRAPGTIGEKKK